MKNISNATICQQIRRTGDTTWRLGIAPHLTPQHLQQSAAILLIEGEIDTRMVQVEAGTATSSKQTAGSKL
jgi:hypothetical protein